MEIKCLKEKVILYEWRARWCIFLLALIFSMPALSDHAADSNPNVEVVDAEGLIDLVNVHADAVVVDARLRSDYVRGHIDGAVNIPNTETNCHTLANIVPEVSLPIIFYCNGLSCMRSAEAIKAARACGYDRVYWFRGGFEEWLAKGYPYLKK